MNPPNLSRSHCKGGGGAVKGGDPCGRPPASYLTRAIVGAGAGWMRGGGACAALVPSSRPPTNYPIAAIVGAGVDDVDGRGRLRRPHSGIVRACPHPDGRRKRPLSTQPRPRPYRTPPPLRDFLQSSAERCLCHPPVPARLKNGECMTKMETNL